MDDARSGIAPQNRGPRRRTKQRPRQQQRNDGGGTGHGEIMPRRRRAHKRAHGFFFAHSCGCDRPANLATVTNDTAHFPFPPPFSFCSSLVLAAAAGATPGSFVTGNVRVQFLSGSLVRLEVKGPAGFENRNTFHVVNRDWPGTGFSVQTQCRHGGNPHGKLSGARAAKRRVAGSTSALIPLPARISTATTASWKTAGGCRRRQTIRRRGGLPTRRASSRRRGV